MCGMCVNQVNLLRLFFNILLNIKKKFHIFLSFCLCTVGQNENSENYYTVKVIGIQIFEESQKIALKYVDFLQLAIVQVSKGLTELNPNLIFFVQLEIFFVTSLVQQWKNKIFNNGQSSIMSV
eukprot:TRINITY_DN54860_c0_g1_i1.p2 TRINITY_DN54860_c0_g1~~TRINITY_DN54860_c0_g1_i1.p2  ORF type:complete len:123 (+),score=3.97 TRINITY_DN54860_c0_g1_i1:2-370(+)